MIYLRCLTLINCNLMHNIGMALLTSNRKRIERHISGEIKLDTCKYMNWFLISPLRHRNRWIEHCIIFRASNLHKYILEFSVTGDTVNYVLHEYSVTTQIILKGTADKAMQEQLF